MCKSWSIFLLGVILASITKGAAIASPITILEQENQATSNSVSTKASDLFWQNNHFEYYQLAEVPLDLEKFCQNYPYNSRCVDRPAPDGTDSEVETEPRERDTTSKYNTPKSGWAIAPEVSTLGLGGSIVRKITPQLNARVSANAFGVGFDVEDTDVTYDGDLNLLNVSTLIDFHPSKNSGFRISGGVVFSDNNVEGTADTSQGGTIGGTDFPAGQLESVDADVDISDSVAPYLGIGGGNAVGEGKGLGFWWNLGVVFGGSPDVSVTPNISADVPADQREQIEQEAQEAAEEEEREIEDDIDFIGVYPVVTLGLSYQF